MRYLKVNLWGHEIGRLVWDSSNRRSCFIASEDVSERIPDIAPTMRVALTRRLPIYGDDRPLYQSLPPFIADSLPDSWGNLLFDKWVADNRIPRNHVTPLYKLMFIGTRGMGALEYEPCASELNRVAEVDIRSLYEMSTRILEQRETMVLSSQEDMTLQALLSVGTSAGGRQMKAILAINPDTGEIRSGQTMEPKGFDHYILKFGDASFLTSEIEYAYYLMATAAGIAMEESRLMEVEGTNHFLTRRFDRREGRKIHVQTLAAMSPEARSYEELFSVCRSLGLTESELAELYARLVFNVVANNTDDHNKNFSFLLEEGGSWRLAPAYDVTFIYNSDGTAPNSFRRLGIRGKISDITKEDLLDFAKENEVKNPEGIIERVADAVGRFEEFAETAGLPQPRRGQIGKALRENLARFGYGLESDSMTDPFTDSFGRRINDFSIRINSKGIYEVRVIIDGTPRRRFVSRNSSLYSDLERQDVHNLPLSERRIIVETLFSPEE